MHVSMSNKRLLNIFQNFFPNEFIICNSEGPIWMNKKNKSKIISKK